MPENLIPLIWGESSSRDTEILEPAAYCLIHKLDVLEAQGARPWAPGRREELVEVERRATKPADVWCLSEVDIFVDLSAVEMDAIAAAAPMRTYPAGSLIFSPNEPMETLFILKAGRVRVFRIAVDGRALTTAILSPGTIFGEMLLLGQQMHDNFAEALDEVVVCVMSRSDVQRFLLADARIALRISEFLGRRVSQLERRLVDTVFKSVPQRVASTLCVLAEDQPTRWRGRLVPIALTHEQIAALSGTSRETATKVLGEFAERGLLRLGRGKMTILDLDGLADAAAQ